ncbi:MAG TPA: hypothetical protein ENI65_05995 [Gammaproteobacteria bacterium]|mgnify:CR=1 FL=1|nr:hypothetical protein [Gammaproteobacteria bacterium]
MSAGTRTALFTSRPELTAIVQARSDEYGIPVVNRMDEADYCLILENHPSGAGYLCCLQQIGSDAPGSVHVDFTKGKVAHRRLYGGGRKQPLARAVGVKPGISPSVIDATAGLGRDGFVLACMGCQVTMLERNPVIFELLSNGLQRAGTDPEVGDIVNRQISLIHADAIDYLGNIDPQSIPDTIYLDPMYPAREKSALVKKEMRYFHDIAGNDGDSGRLLAAAMRCKPKRIVVKRPGVAAHLDNRVPATSITSKNTRYDIYL